MGLASGTLPTGNRTFCFAKARFALLAGSSADNRQNLLQADFAAFHRLVRFCLYAEEVPHSPFGVDVAGFAGVGFNFFAEAADVDIYGADIPGIVCAPDEV